LNFMKEKQSKKSKHKHKFELDGGPCLICGKTMVEIFEEDNQKRVDKIFADRMVPDALGNHSSIESWERSHGHGFWGSSANGYVEDKYNR